jgi:hypothetical protein
MGDLEDLAKNYSQLEHRLKRTKELFLAVCALTVPLSLAFFFYPRTIYQPLSYCDSLRLADYELRTSSEDKSKVAVALEALKPLIADCPERDDQNEQVRDRPVYRGRS